MEKPKKKYKFYFSKGRFGDTIFKTFATCDADCKRIANRVRNKFKSESFGELNILR